MSEKTNIQKVFSSLGINLEIGERFMFEGECYEITESDICIANLSRVTGCIFDMINSPEEIKVLSSYSPETIKHARYDMHRFVCVVRPRDCDAVLLCDNFPFSQKRDGISRNMIYGASTIEIPSDQYPEVQPGQCVALEGIVGGGQDG